MKDLKSPAPANRTLWLMISAFIAIIALGSAAYVAYIYLLPKPAPKTAATPKDFDFASSLQKNKIQAGRALNIQHWQTAQGAHVYFVPSPELPILDIRLIFSAGSARDQQLPGLAQLTNTLLLEGTAHHTGDQIAAQFEQLGAQIDTAAYRDMAIVGLRTLKDPAYLTPALELMTEVVSEPAFPQEAFQRNLNLMRVNLQGIQQDPNALIDRALFSALYPNHPYQYSPDGTAESINQLTPNHVQQFYHTQYIAPNCTIAIVGAIDRAQAEQITNQLMAKLTAGTPSAPTPAVAALTAPHQQHINFPSTQTHIALAGVGVAYNDPRYFPLAVGNYIFGGGAFSSILNKTIRQDRGLSYSVYSSFIPMQAAGPFMIALQTKNESANEALQLTKTALKNFIAQGPTPEQLTQAQEYLLASFPLKAASNSSILDYLGLIGFYHLPLNYLDTYRQRIQQVTAQQIQQAFASLIHPDQLVEITLGPQTAITQPVIAAGS